MIDRADRRGHQRLQPHGIAVALLPHPANLGQPHLEVGGGAGRGVEIKQGGDLRLETLHIRRRAPRLAA